MGKKFFGLDIGSSSIRVVELLYDGKNYALVACGKVAAATNALLSESELDQKALAQTIANLAKESKVGTNLVVTSLPETSVATKVIEMPFMSDNEVASAIKWEAEQYIPWPMTETSLDWQIIKRPERSANLKEAKMEILLVAAPTVLVEKYTRILKMGGFEVIGVETEIIALARSLALSDPTSPSTMIVNIGSLSTNICIVSSGVLVFTRTISTGGAAFTRAVATELNLEVPSAEEYKKTYGLDESQLSGKVFNAIKPIFDVLINEVTRAFAFYKNIKPDDTLKRIIFSGGSARLPSLPIYVANVLGNVEVQTADPWKNIKFPQKLNFDPRVDASEFAIAVGLAMKEF